MCLLITSRTPKIADRDLTCYKAMLKDKKTGIILTPYEMVRPNPDALSGYVNFKASHSNLTADELIHEVGNSTMNKFYPELRGKIEEGYIHTYMFASHAQDDMGHELFAKQDYLLFRCVIPKGTEYFDGTYAGWPCLASREIKFQGVV